MDDERPDRSAVVLASGSGKEDGLLQVREIVDLDLDNNLVILTSCRSASGQALAGEGVMSLALAGAQREMIASELPAAAWSGLVVLGDGDLVPLPGGAPFRFRGLPLAITCAAVFILLGLALLLRRGRR